jgi:DNA-binding NarL/FixJ family response regulator
MTMAEATSEHVHLEDATSTSAADPVRVLLVDDSSSFLSGLVQLLDREDMQVVGVATNGYRAIEMARALRPDVVLMDIAMPVMDGIEATRRICAECPAVSVIGVSGLPEDVEGRAIRQAGAIHYFCKGTFGLGEKVIAAIRACGGHGHPPRP